MNLDIDRDQAVGEGLSVLHPSMLLTISVRIDTRFRCSLERLTGSKSDESKRCFGFFMVMLLELEGVLYPMLCRSKCIISIVFHT